MHIIDILLLVVKSEGENGLRGRTLLQKKVYFLSVLREENLGFSAHYYGPYSSFVAEHLDGLVYDGILKEATESWTTASTERNALGEIRRHTYTLTAEAPKFWEDTRKKPSFSEWEKVLESINSQEISRDFNKLSIAAKVHYIVNWREKTTVEEVRQVAKEYGWNVSEDDIEGVLSFLTELRLVSAAEA